MPADSVTLQTRFAPAERVDVEEIRRQQALLANHPGLDLVLRAPGLTFVLNGSRQIILAAEGAAEALGLTPGDALGQRPGEALGCLHSRKEEAGCGTSEHCAECGAVNAILKGLKGRQAVEECQVLRLTEEKIEAMDLRVSAYPLEAGGETFSIFAVQDASHEKRRMALERIFFHDVLNAVGGLKGLMGFLAQQPDPKGCPHADDQDVHGDETPAEAFAILAKKAFCDFALLLDLIKSQREYMNAERGDLPVRPTCVPPGSALQVMATHFGSRPLGAGKTIVVENDFEHAELETDFDLLRRALSAMVQNALEAEGPGGVVRLSCEQTEYRGETGVRFIVRNPSPMNDEARASAFRRAFTTKGAGRGLGLFYLRILAERYLDGAAEFSSDPLNGTTFILTLPLKLPA